LPLAAGELHPVFPDFRVQVVGQGLNELHGVGRFRRRLNLLPGNLLQGAVGNVGRHRIVEQHHILGHQGHIGPQTIQAQILEIMTIQQNAPGGGLVEAGHEIGHRGFAAAGSPHQGHGLSRFNGKADPIQGIAGRIRIAQHHLFHPDFPLGPIQLHGTPVFFRSFIHQGENTFRRRQAALQLGVHVS